MKNILNTEFAYALQNSLSASVNAAWARCREIDNNEDSSISERMAAGREAEQLQNRLDRLNAAIELAEELSGESYL